MTRDLGRGRGRLVYDVDNLPYGVFTTDDEPPRVGVRIGDLWSTWPPSRPATMLELSHVFEAPSLNPLLAWTARPGRRCAPG